MKNIFKLNTVVLALAIASMAAGCKKSFLNDPKPTQQVSEDIVFGSRAGAEAFISGITRTMRSSWSGQATANVMTFYGARIYKGDDMMFLGTGFWNTDYNYNGRTAKDGRPSFVWTYSYYMINQLNNLINGIEKSSLSATDKAQLGGEGKALRAFFYFQLVQEFSQTYTFDKNFPAPPIYKELSLEGKPMSTVSEVYDFIVSDLQDAVAGLTATRLGKSYVNKEVAAGLLARVYQVMGNWAGAQQMANLAYGNDLTNAFAPTLYKSGFDDITNPEWIWGFEQMTGQTYQYTMPCAWLDIDSAPYKVGYMNINFTNKFSATDVRNTFIINNSAAVTRRSRTTKFKFSFTASYALMRKT